MLVYENRDPWIFLAGRWTPWKMRQQGQHPLIVGQEKRFVVFKLFRVRDFAPATLRMCPERDDAEEGDEKELAHRDASVQQMGEEHLDNARCGPPTLVYKLPGLGSKAAAGQGFAGAVVVLGVGLNPLFVSVCEFGLDGKGRHEIPRSRRLEL